ncbi:1-deoxy-D-xylulose-5-phosphate synthase [Amnibacterium kyonggiense]|uniref:1-deoxy-D-xylulose-5-phosphate synthase n=1 Tax=Amnibacterium kyonggiense TaxID=595671 RepID=A0A4R7FM47_9MICO|nr:1-deoxy-D-xylulose-5-phosphate synthase [Amnibacterium kyonggiense]TDS77511.1 1-deoxy-D-xylulose-5-phosphate synthase [Amnibacterium kyonggiense]
MSLLETIRTPKDLRRLSHEQLDALAGEIRAFLIEHVSRTGGHLGPNLGVVELTIAIHRVFDSPKDAIVWDTGHQTYVHKLLTGRQDFSRLRKRGGLSGYPDRAESVHDIVESSHASSSLSWADGISRAFQVTGETDRHVVAVVGDGALTGGMTWEALNNISDDNNRRLVIVVNDNGRSYAPTIGGMARYLNDVRTRRTYRDMQKGSKQLFDRFGAPGRAIYRGTRGAMHGFLARFVNNERMYSNLDIKYLGPIDGHDEAAVENALRQARNYELPVLVHVITQKGRGYAPARADEADRFHAVGVIDPETGAPLAAATPARDWADVFGADLVGLAERDTRIIGVTAAMLRPVGLAPLAERFPRRVIDVGIAEQHAVTSAAGLAFGGLHPVFAVYATFMGRALDQVLMDVALHRAGVTFVLHRAGITGPDGPSHHGMWDLAMLQIVPGMRIASPRDGATLAEELAEAIAVDDAPTVLRLPKGTVPVDIPALERLDDGVDVLARGEGADVLVVAIGVMAAQGLEVARLLAEQGIDVTVVDPRWAVPIAPSLIDLAARHRLVVTIEDGVRVGGVGTRLRQDMRAAGVDTALNEVGLPDAFLPHAERGEILAESGLAADRIAADIQGQLAGTKLPAARPAPTRTRTRT